MGGKKKMEIFMIAGIVLIVAAGLAAYFLIFQKANPPLKASELRIGSAVFNVEVASTSVERARGLSYRQSLGETSGMLFLFGQPAVQNFWMKDMQFPIDMIWIGGGKVVGITENAEPQPGVSLWKLKIYSSPDGINEVLEINAGAAKRNSIKIGDAVVMGQTP